MKTIYQIILLIIICKTNYISAQDMQFTQFYASPLYLNPAFAGANVCSRITLVYRNQWPGINKTYQSYLLSVDHYISKQRLGVGLQFSADDAGTGGLRTTSITSSLSYEILINKLLVIRFGLQPGVVIKSIHFDKLLFGDQLARGGNSGANSLVTVEQPTQTKTFFDMGSGALIYTSNFWIGTSFFHLTKPNESFYTNEGAVLPIKYSVHGGAKFHINEEENDPDLKKSVTLVANYRGQGKFDQFDIGIYYSRNVFTIGLWYRGIPGLKAYKPGYSNNDALAILVGFQKERLHIGYSYDLTISLLQNLTKGAHEITLSYQLCKPHKKTKRVLISCPKF